MVTASETKIRNLLEMKGFTVVHKGAPDFLCYKLNKARRPENIMFIEAKSGKGNYIYPDQLKWLSTLEHMGAKVMVINSDDIKALEHMLKNLGVVE